MPAFCLISTIRFFVLIFHNTSLFSHVSYSYFWIMYALYCSSVPPFSKWGLGGPFSKLGGKLFSLYVSIGPSFSKPSSSAVRFAPAGILTDTGAGEEDTTGDAGSLMMPVAICRVVSESFWALREILGDDVDLGVDVPLLLGEWLLLLLLMN